MNTLLKISIRIVAIGVLAFLAMGANCITTGNVMVVEYLDPLDANSAQAISYGEVNLENNGDWNEHKDDIAAVDDIGFACRITNNGSTVAAGQLYVSELDKTLTTPEQIQEQAILVLDGITVQPGATREIEWQESYDFLMNFEETKQVIFTEHFKYYFIAEETPFNIHVEDIVLFLSVNGKP